MIADPHRGWATNVWAWATDWAQTVADSAGAADFRSRVHDRKSFTDHVSKPLQDKKETLYVLPDSHAEAHAVRRYPHKRVKVVDSGIRGR